MKKTDTIKKCRLYINFLKERDWLEEMAAQGFLLTDITLGIIYQFRKSEPCEKVFEVERFAVSSHPTIQELNARKIAIDIATQSGWEVVTHDEDMNYYFMKDKAGDETDEFYDDEVLRRERAERYRKHLAFESPLNLLKGDLIVSFLYIIVLCLLTYLNNESLFLMWFFIIFSTIEFACILGCMITGERLYRDFSLTREEWNLRKKNSVRKHFHRVQELRSFLQTQSEYGLSLSGYDNGRYLFEEDSCRYNYFVDTKACMKKRLKEQGVHYKDDPKNISAWDLKWYEMSMENAAQYGLKPVAVVQKHVLIYKRPYSDDALPWENGNARISLWQAPTLFGLLLFIGCFLLGVIMGFLSSPFS